MNRSDSRLEKIFFEVFGALPRQGPGSRESTAEALGLCRELPPEPAILDLGCGVGAQTLDLAELTAGTVVAVDIHAPSVARLNEVIDERGLSDRVRAVVGDMGRLELPPDSFDLVWSEGALYNLGLDDALPICRRFVRPGGYVAFTDAVWCTDDPPPEVRASFAEYPTMGRVPDVLAAIGRCGLERVGHFTVPDEAWWTDFYTPMQRRIEELREAYTGDPQALAAVDEIADEPEMHRRHGHHYAYEFFVARHRC